MKHLLALLLVLPLQAKELKVITWNVWNGFNGGKATTESAAWLKQQAPDIVAFQELNGQKHESFASLAKKWDHPHSALLKENGYPVGISSRQPIEVVARHREGLGHGCLQVRTSGFEIFIVHLHPGDWQIRTREMKILTRRIDPLIKQGERVIVLGDFNAHSPADRVFLTQQTALLERRKGKNLKKGDFDYGVLEGFIAAGLEDLSESPLPESRTFPTRIFPTTKSKEEQAKVVERIDFILADPATARACKELTYPTDERLDRCSDHYPVAARLTVMDSGAHGR